MHRKRRQPAFSRKGDNVLDAQRRLSKQLRAAVCMEADCGEGIPPYVYSLRHVSPRCAYRSGSKVPRRRLSNHVAVEWMLLTQGAALTQ